MVVIRLSLRARPKNHKHYQILVADQRYAPNKRYIERVGSYDPSKKDDNGLILDLERIEHWISQGAQMTPRLMRLVKTYKKQDKKQEESK